MCRDSNPAGCGAEETRSVFQRSTQGAERRSESGRRQPHADIPLGAPFETRSPLPPRWRAFFYPNAGIRTRQGAELRKREAFSSAARKERSDAAKAGGASRTRTSRWGHHLRREARYPRGDGLFLPMCRDSNPAGCGPRQIGGKTDSKASFAIKKPGPARCGPRLNTVTICWLCPTRRTGCRRRSGPASSRRPPSPPWHPRRHAAYP